MESNIEILGRKVFFIAPTDALIPESYVEDFLTHGYEPYIIADDGVCPLKKKIEAIARLFPGSILFFNIDAAVESIGDWKSYIADFRAQHREQVLIGVLHRKGDAEQDEALRDFYVEHLHLSCGFIALQAKQLADVDAIKEVLEEYEARGRRQFVRATMDEQSRFTGAYNGKKIDARVLDVNIRHFACLMGQNITDLKIFDKVRGASLRLSGLEFTSDAVLLMKRTKGDETLYVFMFITPPQDIPELPAETKQKLNHKIYQVVSDGTLTKLRDAFRA